MKKKQMNVGLFAAVALALTQAGSAAASVIGFFDFEGTKPLAATDETADYTLIAGVSGWVTSRMQATIGSGGSYDMTYGDGPSTSPQQPLQLPPGDGSATIRKLDAGSLSLYSVLTFWIMNETATAIDLGALYFDAAEIPPPGPRNEVLLSKIWEDATFDPGALPPGAAGDFALWSNPLAQVLGPDVPVIGSTTGNDYTGYMFSLAGRTLSPGETIAIMFTGKIADPNQPYTVNTILLDNLALAIGAIPEPGSILGLGFVLASGLMLRNRRIS